MGKKPLHTDKAAVLGGPYSQAIIHNGLIFISGQGAIDPETKQTVHGTIEEETDLAIENIRAILKEAGASLDNILKVTVFLNDINEYSRFNEIYRQYFKDPLPARTCIEAGNIPFGLKVEIDAIAHL